jgi:hypothetical protein
LDFRLLVIVFWNRPKNRPLVYSQCSDAGRGEVIAQRVYARVSQDLLRLVDFKFEIFGFTRIVVVNIKAV